jgi:hypothetical protein
MRDGSITGPGGNEAGIQARGRDTRARGRAGSRARERPCEREAQHDHARMQHARQPPVVRHRRAEAVVAERSHQHLRDRPRKEPGEGGHERHAGAPAHERDDDGADHVDAQVRGAPVHPRTRPQAPRLAQAQRRLPIERRRQRGGGQRRSPLGRDRRDHDRAQAQQGGQRDPGHAIDAKRALHAPGPNTARHNARPAARSGASVSSGNSVGCSSSRARCCARRSSR